MPTSYLVDNVPRNANDQAVFFRIMLCMKEKTRPILRTESIMRTSEHLSAELPRLLRAREVAVALGVSRALAYRWMASGVLPTLRRGRCIRVPKAALEEWIAMNTSRPAA